MRKLLFNKAEQPEASRKFERHCCQAQKTKKKEDVQGKLFFTLSLTLELRNRFKAFPQGWVFIDSL